MSSQLLLTLPDDILFSMCSYLRVEDILSLQQTCRVLHAFCAADYMWHNINSDLPLDIAPDVDSRTLSGSDLRQLFVRALRVDANWCTEHSRLRGMHRIEHGGIVFRMHFLAPEWLVTMSRVSGGSGTMCNVSVWRIDDTAHATRVQTVSFDTQYMPKFSAAFRNGRREVVVAIFGSVTKAELLKVYVIPLQDTTGSPSRFLVTSMPQTTMANSAAYEAHICGNIICFVIARFNNISEAPSYQLLFLDLVTGSYTARDVEQSLPFTQIRLRLFRDFFVLAGVQKFSNLVLQIYDAANILAGFRDRSCTGSRALHDPVTTYSSFVVPYTDLDHVLSAETSSSHLHSITSLSFPPRNTYNYVVKFPLPSSKDFTRYLPQEEVTIHRFRTLVNARAEIVCIGQTGRRAVWLERRWDTDSFALMKATFPSDQGGQPIIQNLFPAYMVLPFQAHTCQSIAFNEATGQVCLGLHTGDLYLLQF